MYISIHWGKKKDNIVIDRLMGTNHQSFLIYDRMLAKWSKQIWLQIEAN